MVSQWFRVMKSTITSSLPQEHQWQVLGLYDFIGQVEELLCVFHKILTTYSVAMGLPLRDL